MGRLVCDLRMLDVQGAVVSLPSMSDPMEKRSRMVPATEILMPCAVILSVSPDADFSRLVQSTAVTLIVDDG